MPAFLTRHARVLKWVIFLLFFLMHLTAALYIARNHRHFYLANDGDEYISLSRSLLEKGAFVSDSARYYEAPRTGPAPELFRSLFLSLLGSGFGAVFRDLYVGTAVMQALLCTLLALVLFRIGEHLAGRTAAFCTLILFSVHPLFVTFSLRFSSEILFSLLLACYILFFLKTKGLRQAVLMGLAGGLAAVTRPTALLLLPAFAVFLLCVRLLPLFRRDGDGSGEPLKRIAARYGLYAAVFLVCLIPDSIRTIRYCGEVRPSYYLGGFNTFLGNCRENMEAYRAHSGRDFLLWQDRAWARTLDQVHSFPENLPPSEQQKRLVALARQEITEAGPANYLRLLTAKAWHFVRPWPLHGAHPSNVFYAVFSYELVLFALGFIGIFLLRKKKRFLLLTLMILCVGWFAHTLVHLQMRHRVPFLDLSLLFFAGTALAEGGRVWFARIRRRGGKDGATAPAADRDGCTHPPSK